MEEVGVRVRDPGSGGRGGGGTGDTGGQGLAGVKMLGVGDVASSNRIQRRGGSGQDVEGL